MGTIKGSDLRTMRLHAGLTTMQMATAAGVKTRTTYENWEKDVGIPNVNQYFKMADACGLSHQELLLHLITNDMEKQGSTGSIKDNGI